MNLKESPWGGLIVQDYVNTYCNVDTKKIGSQLHVEMITYLRLNVIIITMVSVASSTYPHISSDTYMYYFFKCMWLTVYHWYPPFLGNLKSHMK